MRWGAIACGPMEVPSSVWPSRSEEHTSELQSPCNLVCRLLLEKKIVMPLSAPALLTLIVVHGLWVCNELLIALIFLPRANLQTLIVRMPVFLNKFNQNVPVTLA